MNKLSTTKIVSHGPNIIVFDDVYYLIYSSVCRTKKKEKGEANADIVSTVSKYTA